jgi:hypothetical protein
VIDIGLLVSIAAVVIVPSVFLRPWPPQGVATDLLDIGLGPLVLGLVGGRIAAMALDDPSSLRSIRDIMIIRSGVEFWPGVALGCAWLLWRARRDRTALGVQLASLSVAALIAWATFEATCLLRDGCPGPRSAVGLRPAGLSSRVFPVGLAVAAAAAAAAHVVARMRRRGLEGSLCALVAVTAIAAIRAVSSIWLPHIGSGLTRQHRESIAVLLVAPAFIAVVHWRHWRGRVSAVDPVPER